MAEYIAIPKLGMQMTEATLVEWKVSEGGRVEKGDVVLTIETEKTEWEVEAAASGLVHILMPAEITAPVARVVGMIVETDTELEELRKEPPGEIYTSEAGATAAQAEERQKPAASVETGAPVATGERKRVRISPVARKMAEERMIDITTVTGTGPEGRIVREDIEKAIEAKERGDVPAKVETATAASGMPATGEVYQGKRVKSTLPLKSMRKVIAEHMHRSLSISAQLTQMGEIDMTELKKLRATLVKQEETIGARITYTDILVLAAAKVLKELPIVNASLIENEIKLWEDINVGVAVAIEGGTGGGLIVPVVKNADRKSLVEINRELKVMVEQARNGKLMPDDVTGGTFTVTNLGAFGGGYGFGTPIINQPESAIIGTGSIVDRPVVREGQIVIRPIMTYSFTFDHRVIDGAPATMFMLRLTEVLENPGLLLL